MNVDFLKGQHMILNTADLDCDDGDLRTMLIAIDMSSILKKNKVVNI